MMLMILRSMSSSQEDANLTKARVECCVQEIIRWMIANILKLNHNKTELAVIGSKYKALPSVTSIQVEEETNNHQSTVQNLGVIFDQTMSFNDQISKICKSSNYHLSRNIGKIKKYLDENSTEALIHAFVTSELDYYNALFNGLPKYQTNRLQLVLNTAARVVTRTHKYEHITPVLIGLCWLPISYRITCTFKILLLIYKTLNNLAPSYRSDVLS